MCAFGRNSRHFKQSFDNYMGCFTFCCFNVCQMNLPEGVLAQSLIVIYVPYWVTFLDFNFLVILGIPRIAGLEPLVLPFYGWTFVGSVIDY